MPNYTPYKKTDYKNMPSLKLSQNHFSGSINQQLRDKTSIYLNVRSESSGSSEPEKHIV